MKLRVKIRSRLKPRLWRRQLPDDSTCWGDCEFILDPDCQAYDWLVVYEDLPRAEDDPALGRDEILACPSAHTLLVTTEPSSIKTYGSAFVEQFGHVLTSQEAWALPHPHRIFSQPALRWFYGAGRNHERTLDQMRAAQPAKKRSLSTVCSSKQQRFTLHYRRYRFTQQLKAEFPELEVFGHGVRAMDDKAEALDDYRYHITVENYVGPHHWTEKLADAFLGFTLPLYHGCPNAAEYFPPESFLNIDISQLSAACETIRAVLRDNEYEKRLPAILEARRRVLEQYNFFAVVARTVAERHQLRPRGSAVQRIRPRQIVTRCTPLRAARILYERTRSRLIHRVRSPASAVVPRLP